MQNGLFDNQRTSKSDVRFIFPNLSGVKRIGLDTETTGLKIFGGDKAIALSIATEDGQSWYIPWGHTRGFNFEIENVKAWIKDNLQGKEATLINAKFDSHMLFNAGIDIEQLEVNLHDVAYHAAIVNSKRQSYKLADLARIYTKRNKLELDGTLPIHHRYSEDVSDYARMDASLVLEIEDNINKIIDKEELWTVKTLEDSLIYMVCHMERNGAYIDREKLELWQRVCEQRMSGIFWQLAREAGFKVEPMKSISVVKLCRVLGIDVAQTVKGADSITNEFLVKTKHPLLELCFEYRKLSDLKSDYLDKYLLCLDSNNKIHYNLNQLKSDNFGTVTGRFSSSGSEKANDDPKINVQQVVKVSDDLDDVEDNIIRDMPIRELFIPEPGCDWFDADASQLQFRIFAHYSNDERLVREYRENPKADFHDLMAKKILGGLLKRKDAKHENFGNLFGMGIEKGARRLGVSVEKYKEIKAIYHKHFPAAKRLGYQAQGLARHPSMGPHEITGKIGRGYVRTISKRRRRYDAGENLNSAVNAVIQGTEADIVKDKAYHLYRNRKQLHINNIYFTVHDSFDGGTPKGNREQFKKNLTDFLNDHSTFETRYGVKFKVPILWEVELGDTWNG